MIKKGDRVNVKSEYTKLYHALNKVKRNNTGDAVELDITVLGIDTSIDEANVSGLWRFVPMSHLEHWKPAKPKKDIKK